MYIFFGADRTWTCDLLRAKQIFYQLNYSPIYLWQQRGLNSRPNDYDSFALPTELCCLSSLSINIPGRVRTYNLLSRNQILFQLSYRDLWIARVGVEPTTFGSWARWANHCSTLHYKKAKDGTRTHTTSLEG